jgi:hypothetical protein
LIQPHILFFLVCIFTAVGVFLGSWRERRSSETALGFEAERKRLFHNPIHKTPSTPAAKLDQLSQRSRAKVSSSRTEESSREQDISCSNTNTGFFGVMRPSFSMAASLATSLLAVWMVQPVHALNGALPVKLMGCYGSNQGLTLYNTSVGDSSGFCQEICFPLGKAVMAMTGELECWCGDQMPNLSTQVSDSNCNASCRGFPADQCTHTLITTFVL